MERLKVGVIGAGFIGTYHARIYAESFGAELKAIADVDKSRGQEFKKNFGCAFYTDYREMLAKEDLDAVDICLPDDNHVGPAVAAAKAGKHILLEKPMARTVKDCKKIKEACDKYGVRIMIAHVLRFDPGYNRMHDAVKNGEIGDVIHISAGRRNNKLLAQRLKDSTSMLFYVGIHDIDAVQWCAGKRITRVFAQRVVKENKKWKSEDCIYVLANLGKETVAHLEYSWLLPSIFPCGLKSNLEIYGSRATALLNKFNQGVEVYKDKGAELPFELTDTSHWPECNNRIDGALKAEIDHFIDAILNKRKFVMPLDDMISAVNVIEAIMESYKKDKPVDVKPL
ncbi:MAG TPA: Gfo/Idh/MocA family oxidoreductase [bacterium]|nr:Gfo/Idh/MocA family oxidoreductase [bacterium]